MKVKNIALFASGSGTNVENIIKYFSDNELVKVDSVWSNNPMAFALERAKRFNIDAFVFTKDEFRTTNKVIEELKKRSIDLIVLAGFLWLIPVNLIQNFPIVNIHPALLPKYGGKGMYGMKVHQAVFDNREKESGITIHYVNEKYDEGEIIFQAKCEILSTDCADDVALKVHDLEYRYFPEIIEKVLLGKI
ncbi:MAG TPA: phosphoribosylglycinamide formyltransferase [Draconibacterium sp.]|nr:phosphoribosylglycinamide formyltransferase [Draconibacterium sp.]